MATTPSTYMNLPIPIVGVEPGPQYATDNNSCFTIVDAHDHTPGNGVQITPNGINISSNLPFNNNNAITVRSLRFTPQSSALNIATDLGCLYEVTNDLYYNDGAGNQIRITQSGSIAGTSGSITGLVSPASASYSAITSTFTFQSAANTAASLDGRNFILRNSTASSFGLTLSPPSAMAANFTITLPSTPGANNTFVMMSTAGAMSAIYTADGIAGQMSSTGTNTIRNTSTVSTATTAVTRGNVMLTGSSGGYSNATGTYTTVTNCSGSITVGGNPVEVCVIADGLGASSNLNVNTSSSSYSGIYGLFRGATKIAEFNINSNVVGSTAQNMAIPPSHVRAIDVPTAGTYTYSFQAYISTGSSVSVNNCRLYVKEQF